MKPINVLSLFDGMSGGQIALERAGIPVANYFASEIDKYAIKVTQHHYPNTHQLGTILGWKSWQLPKIDLVIAGSPCQGFSKAGKGLNFDDPRSKLFFTYLDILNHHKEQNPDLVWWLENVRMKKEWQDVISDLLGVEPVLINSALVSAQNRERLYWANFSITKPQDKGILLKDVILGDVFPVALHNIYGGFGEKENRVFTEKSPTIRTAAGGGHIPSLLHTKEALEYMERQTKDGRTHWDFLHHSDVRNKKSAAIVANFFKGVPYNVLKDWNCIRKFHPVECERLQTVEDGWTSMVSNTQRYRMLGNGWTIDTIVHIINCSPLNTSLDRSQIDSTLPQSLPSLI